MSLHPAALHYLLVRARRVGLFGGSRLATDDDWAQLFDAIEASLRAGA